MQTKHIDKLEDLKGHEWECRGLQLKLDGFDIRNETLQLHSKNFLSEIGDIIGRFEFIVSKYNVEQLEFYGLKVVLNEKPKLTREERERISRESYFARDENDNLYEYLDKPRQSKEFGRWQTDYAFIQINPDLFPFITWESGTYGVGRVRAYNKRKRPKHIMLRT